ncbi:MAG: methyltransferase [Pseudomonadota bacterium]
MKHALVALGNALRELGYRFTTVTPETHARVNSRPGSAVAKDLRDVFGWSRPFETGLLPAELVALMNAAEVCERMPNSQLWRATVRFSSIGEVLFAHSAFPTSEADAVFFGPDSVRFVHALQTLAPLAKRVVDVGCGCGVGGIMLRKRDAGFEQEVVLADINERALDFARVNAALAGVSMEVVQSDVLSGVRGEIDLVIANPPYLVDDSKRTYRDGGGTHGEAIAARITLESLHRLAENPHGGTLLLYTGSAIVAGTDSFFEAVRRPLAASGVRFSYQELDPDVFSTELACSSYADAERIAVVLLQAQVAPRPGPARGADLSES